VGNAVLANGCLQGIPSMTVPAGFTTMVYDRVRDPGVDPAAIDDTATPEGYGFGHRRTWVVLSLAAAHYAFTP
jgi:hypothetical protein